MWHQHINEGKIFESQTHTHTHTHLKTTQRAYYMKRCFYIHTSAKKMLKYTRTHIEGVHRDTPECL